MEVHHHAHTARKRWTHYFWEFIMLFLAVFFGYLAEYKLEHVIEHNREKKYMLSMLEDLGQDTVEINRVVEAAASSQLNLDTLLNFLENPNFSDSRFIKKLYYIHFYHAGSDLATLSQRTMSQLKNAGGLRLIRSKSIADTISVYDVKSQELILIQRSFDEISTQVYLQGAYIFDNRYMRNSYIDSNVKLLTIDPSRLRPYSNHIFMDQAMSRFYQAKLIECKNLAIKLIALIKQYYHFQ